MQESQDQNKILIAMKMQPNDTYGLFLSPILAHFQKIPPTLQKIILTINTTKFFD